MKAKKILVSLLSACMVLSLVGCGGSDTAPKGGSAPAGGGGGGKIMTIGTADSGGTMYPVGAGVAKVCNANIKGIKINVATSTGSYENARNIQEGNIDLATIAGDTAYDAINLFKNGFKLFEFETTMYQELDMEILFCRKGIIKQREIPLESIWDIASVIGRS